MTIDYKSAQRDESLRQEYLGGFFTSFGRRTDISGFIYNLDNKPVLDKITSLEEEEEIDGDTANGLREAVSKSKQKSFLILTPGMLGKNNKHSVFVNPGQFESSDEDYLTLDLIYHEGQHARDFKRGIFLEDGVKINYERADQLQPVTLECILDIRAYHNQLIWGQRLGLWSFGPHPGIAKEFKKYFERLKAVKPENYFEEMVVKAALKGPGKL